MVEGLSVIKATTGVCKGCVIGKHPEHKFDRGKANRATCILGMIHSDISGLMLVTSMMDQGIFLILLMIFQGTHGSSFSKITLKYVKISLN